MWWYGRGNSGGSRLPEKKKANMWHGRGNSGGSWPPAFLRSPWGHVRRVHVYWIQTDTGQTDKQNINIDCIVLYILSSDKYILSNKCHAP